MRIEKNKSGFLEPGFDDTRKVGRIQNA